MASDLLSIARSGTKAARTALDVTAQNIANASSEGYVRRSLSVREVASAGSIGGTGEISLSGVRIAGIVRNADMFRQSEVRRTGSDSARADAEVAGLENIEAAIEGADSYTAITKFEASLQQLATDPTNGSLRAATMEQANTLAASFNITSQGLDSVRDGLQFEAVDATKQINMLSQELSRVNLRLTRAADASSDQSSLLDQRDSLLQTLSQYTDVHTTFSSDNQVEVRLGGASGELLVQGGNTATLTTTAAANGTISFAVGGNAVTLAGGSLAGKAQALDKVADMRTKIDTIAGSIITAANTAQAAGADLNGAAGQPMFSGTTAADMKLALTSGSQLATAPAGSPGNSRDISNLEGLRAALKASDPAAAMDSAIFDISSTVAGRTISRDALRTISSNAQIALASQAGVDLDQEALNLIRFQQAFQASGKVMQVASDIFDTILGINR